MSGLLENMLTPKINETENLFRPKCQRLSMLKTFTRFENQILSGTLMQGRVLELNTECDVEPDWIRVSQTIGNPRQTTPMFVFALLLHLHVRKPPQGWKSLRSFVSRCTSAHARRGEQFGGNNRHCVLEEDREREREKRKKRKSLPLLTHFHTLRER